MEGVVSDAQDDLQSTPPNLREWETSLDASDMANGMGDPGHQEDGANEMQVEDDGLDPLSS